MHKSLKKKPIQNELWNMLFRITTSSFNMIKLHYFTQNVYVLYVFCAFRITRDNACYIDKYHLIVIANVKLWDFKGWLNRACSSLVVLFELCVT